jgi:hypothetical protein
MPSAKDMKLLALIATLAVAGASAYLLFAGGGGGGNGRAVPIVWTLPTVTAPAADLPSPESQSTRKSHVGAPRSNVPVPQLRLDPPPDNVKGPSFPIATLVSGHRIALHTSPAGTVFKQVGDRTEFGSTRAFWIEGSREDGSAFRRRIYRTEDLPGFATTGRT